jgi:hypothetical protein
MNPNPRSTVMEFFYPEGFAYDYEYTTRALGMVHYGFWGDKYAFSSFTHVFNVLTLIIDISHPHQHLYQNILKASKETLFQ